MTRVADLRELAHAFGVATEYYGQDGEHVVVARDVIADVLRSLGADPTDEATIAASLEQRRMRDWRRTLPPVFVTIAGQERTIWVHLPHGDSVVVDVVAEDGSTRVLPQVDRWIEPREVDGVLTGEATFAIPTDLPLGWHTVRAQLADRTVESPLVVTPARLDPPALHAKDRMWGFMAQLYSVRSRDSWGIGDLADLTDLATWSAHELGSDFVLINPLHAPAPVTPMSASPYLPATRRFTNPLYLRIEGIAEYGNLKGSQVKAIRRLAKAARRVDGGLLDRDTSWAAKREALDIVRTVALTPGRQAAYDAYVASQGNGLVDACTWAAIAERLGPTWRDWPRVCSIHDRLRWRDGAPSMPTMWNATCGCSGSSMNNCSGRRCRRCVPEWRSVSSTISRWDRPSMVPTRGRFGMCWPAVSASVHHRICTTSGGRTGHNPHGIPMRSPMRDSFPIETCCARSCAMPVGCVSTM